MIGERTFGEGSVQKTIELPDGAALLLTVAKYQSPAGKKIQDTPSPPTGRGAPAVDEEPGRCAPPAKGDEALDKALSVLKIKKG